jgi:hypothetical protein
MNKIVILQTDALLPVFVNTERARCVGTGREPGHQEPRDLLRHHQTTRPRRDARARERARRAKVRPGRGAEREVQCGQRCEQASKGWVQAGGGLWSLCSIARSGEVTRPTSAAVGPRTSFHRDCSHRCCRSWPPSGLPSSSAGSVRQRSQSAQPLRSLSL